ncbi:MAG: zinc ribbon domain-containing protein [Halorubrum sp.]|uniref:DUF7575 domain-containing protein n=1 Tax=Halorubrum sp. TaxID=1879286 RepID=UPI003970C64D
MPDHSRRRPWLAVLLALVVSGLGHAYLRRWGRAFGWYVAVTATLVFIVPDAAVDGIVAGDPPPVADVAPALVVVAASVIDAYVLAVRNNRELEREERTASERAAPGAPTEQTAPATQTDGTSLESEARPDRVSCPHCGRQTDPSFDFCQWCAEPVSE